MQYGTPFSDGKSEHILNGLSRCQAMAEFDLSGNILWANDNFLHLVGYSLEELRGAHHSIFVDPEYAKSEEYRNFWSELRQGQCSVKEFRRFGKGGKEIWMQACYAPIFDENGVPQYVIKIASDTTARKQSDARAASKLSAIERSMAVIEFSPSGTIHRCNDLFLQTMGYSADDLIGQHHRIFVRPEHANSAQYDQFWNDLADGKVVPGQFERLRKDGKPVWLEATYNPILDPNGNTISVIKFATDVTDKVLASQEIEANSKELSLALDKAKEAERVREQMDRALQEMSTPVTPIWDGILLLPLVGVVDSTRTDDVMRKTLLRISEHQAKMFILDISGVPTVDTAVANQLIKITKATRFMGCETIISGLSPAIAHTMVDLGVDVGEVRTTATLRDAFRIALHQVREQAKQANQSNESELTSSTTTT